jgi:hypothetical protein
MRKTPVDDDYMIPHHLSYCGAKTNAVCFACKKTFRVVKYDFLLPKDVKKDVFNPVYCACGKELTIMSTKFKAPKKNKWKKICKKDKNILSLHHKANDR